MNRLSRVLTMISVGIPYVVFLLMCPSPSHAQSFKIHSFDFGGHYTEATKFNDDSVDHAENYGYAAQMKVLTPLKGLKIGLDFSYTPLRISEYDRRVAGTRGGWVYFTTYYNAFRQVENFKKTDGTPYYTGGWYYSTYNYNYSLMITLEYSPMPAGFFIQPYVAAGAGPVMYNTRGYLWFDYTVTHDTHAFHYYNAIYNGQSRTRGFWWPGTAAFGVDIKFTGSLGMTLQGNYYTVLKKHAGNWVDAYYRVKAGLVIYGL